MSPKLALALFQIIIRLIAAAQQAEWYQKGRAEALKEMSDEQRQRIALADAARADVDAFADGRVHDPLDRG